MIASIAAGGLATRMTIRKDLGHGRDGRKSRQQIHLTRHEADEFAVRSHQRAAAAWERGGFDDEVIPVEVPQRKGEALTISRDEGIRADTSVAKLESLRPIIPGGTVTAGSASQQNDAGAACLVVGEDRLAELGLDPIGYLVDWAAVGCDPATMGIGLVKAVAKILKRNGPTLDEMARVEINEAFAVQVLAVLAELEWRDDEKLNVNGSRISLGHPIGAAGLRTLNRTGLFGGFIS
jgi:acetyl-CoA C-acetyltransferase